MKEIINQYGKAFISIIAFAAVFGIIFGFRFAGHGMISKAKEGGSLTYTVDKMDEKRIGFFDSHRKMQIEAASDILAGKDYELKDLIRGQEIKDIRLIFVKNQAGVDITDRSYKDERINFDKEGIYKIKIWADAADGAFGTETLYIGVAAG